MKNLIKIVLLLFAVSWMQPSIAKNPQTQSVVAKAFLISTEGTYGWQPVTGDISYDFFPDGRLHIQGPDGEATMWEGKWTLKGDQLTLINKDLKTTVTVTVTKDGDDLLLNDQRYSRYKPQ